MNSTQNSPSKMSRIPKQSTLLYNEDVYAPIILSSHWSLRDSKPFAICTSKRYPGRKVSSSPKKRRIKRETGLSTWFHIYHHASKCPMCFWFFIRVYRSEKDCRGRLLQPTKLPWSLKMMMSEFRISASSCLFLGSMAVVCWNFAWDSNFPSHQK